MNVATPIAAASGPPAQLASQRRRDFAHQPADSTDPPQRETSIVTLSDGDGLAVAAITESLRISFPTRVVRHASIPPVRSPLPTSMGDEPPPTDSTTSGHSPFPTVEPDTTLLLWKPRETLMTCVHARPFRYRVVLVTTDRISAAWADAATRLSLLSVISPRDSLETLITALQHAMVDQPFVSMTTEDWFRASGDRISQRESACPRPLTTRQAEVLQLLALGFSIRDTAVRLGLTEKTVESHRYRVCKRLGVHDRRELVQIAIREGLVSV